RWISSFRSAGFCDRRRTLADRMSAGWSRPPRSSGEVRPDWSAASLEELGALADPPLTKDAIAGRIRRLLALADKRARDLGIPDTEAAVTPEMMVC
ncbi:MAG: cell division protein WhiA, partial [Actinoplanes sp.]|nr:cell division protein WhiA [Actinoplanes sp.]